MKPYVNIITFLIVIVTLTLAQSAAAIGIFMSKDIKGTIVDADTGEPIEGVVVTASWILLPWGTSRPYGTLRTAEGLTNDQGQYTLPGWGPKVSFLGHLEDDQPVVRFFKPGYVPLVVENNSVYHPGLEDDREHMIKEEVMYGDRKGIRMYEPEVHRVRFGEKTHTFGLGLFSGTNEQYVDLLKKFNTHNTYIRSLGYLMEGNTCEWKLLPLTFTTLHKLSTKLGIPKNRGILFVSNLGGQDRCGGAEEYFKEYLQ